MAGNVRQGLTAGIIVALISSLGVGVTAESFWGPFLVSLVFSMGCVGAATWLVGIAERRRS